MKSYKAVLFDLDGTINDSGPGIMTSAQYAIEKAGYPPLSEDTLRKFVGPSLLTSFMTQCHMTEDDAWKAIGFYRELYMAGELYHLDIYPGMRTLLETIRAAGMKIAVATSKPYAAAENVLEHFYLRPLFDCVAGPDPSDPSNDKAVLIVSALRRLNVSARDAVMVGDTRFDILGAHKAGCDSIGVTYGYGTTQELTENRATYLADSAGQIAEILGLTLPK